MRAFRHSPWLWGWMLLGLAVQPAKLSAQQAGAAGTAGSNPVAAQSGGINPGGAGALGPANKNPLQQPGANPQQQPGIPPQQPQAGGANVGNGVDPTGGANGLNGGFQTGGAVGGFQNGSNGNIANSILMWLSQVLQSDIELANLAQQQAQSQPVRELAAMIVQQDTAVLQMLSQGNMGQNSGALGGATNGTAGAANGAAQAGGSAGLNAGGTASATATGGAGVNPAAAQKALPGALPAAGGQTAGAAQTGTLGGNGGTATAGGTLGGANGGVTAGAGATVGSGNNTAATGSGLNGIGANGANGLGASGNNGFGVGNAGTALMSELLNLGANFDQAYVGIQLARQLERGMILNAMSQAAATFAPQALAQLVQLNQQQIQMELNVLRQVATLSGQQGNANRRQAVDLNNPSLGAAPSGNQKAAPRTSPLKKQQ